MKIRLTILFFFFSMYATHAQLTYVPDDAFEAYLETFPTVSNGIAGDNYVNSNSVVTLQINGSVYPVTDFTGIETFTNLSSILLTSFLTPSIDISGVPSAVPEITIQGCSGVVNLFLPEKICFLTINGNSLLKNIVFHTNTETVAVPNAPNFGSNIIIKFNNSLEIIDLSGVSLLNSTGLNVQNNPVLTCVNIQNGDNFIFSGAIFIDNNQLGCVQVDNPTYSTNASTWLWMNGATEMDQYYSTSCLNCTLGLEETTQTFALSPNPVHDRLNITVPSSFVGEEFHVYTGQGEQVQQGVISSEQQSISVDQLPSGVYFFSVDGMLPERVVKL